MPRATSIVLCTYNGARFLEAQWESLLAQSRRPDEIVVRDDGSTDGTPALLARLRVRAEAQGIRVSIAGNAHNLGYSANFAAALQGATGEVLYLCDQDDVWHPDKLATLSAAFDRRPELLLACTDARRVDAAGVDLGRSLFGVLRITRAEFRAIHRGDGFAVLLRRSMATGATVALRRTLLADALPVPPGWVHDEWLAIVAAALGGFDCIERRLIDYRQHGGNQIGMPGRGLREKWDDLRRPRADLIEMLIARDEWLAKRLRRLREKVQQGCIECASAKLAHMRVRHGIAGAPCARVAPILRETFDGGYRRFGTGWRSALRDFLRRR
ncbi:MAG: glycosyltransferase family 2 protein [Rhodanobacteraceae bacterium]|nr:MAG: glycosyltransferase family 2 protein [Rhodanobacteraceae bacterium]